MILGQILLFDTVTHDQVDLSMPDVSFHIYFLPNIFSYGSNFIVLFLQLPRLHWGIIHHDSVRRTFL